MFILLKSRIRNALKAICPFGEDELFRMTRAILIKTCVPAMVLIAFFLFSGLMVEGRISGFSVIAACFMGFIVIREVPFILIGRTERKFMSELGRYFASVKRKYRYCGNIPNAVTEGASDLSGMIFENAAEIYEILMSEDRRERVRDYVHNKGRNRFLKLFLIQAYETSENGDTTCENGKSCFSENMTMLRMELMKHMYDVKHKSHMFAGYMTVAVLPVLLFFVIKKMGIGLLPELQRFYIGPGRFVLLFAFIIAYFIYEIICDIKGNRIEEVFIGTSRTVRRVDNYISENGGTFIRRLTGLIYDADVSTTPAAVLIKMAALTAGTLILGICFTVTGRMNTGFIRWYELFLVLMLSVSVGFIPLLRLIYRRSAIRALSKDEVKRLQMVIAMEYGFPNMTTVNLLEDMEMFSDYFQREIRECINMYSSGPIEALAYFKTCCDRKCEAFVSISDAFLAIDDVGVTEAFSDIKNDRACLIEMNELDESIRSEEKKNLMDILCWIPGAVMIFGYFVVPFTYEAVTETKMLFSMFEM